MCRLSPNLAYLSCWNPQGQGWLYLYRYLYLYFTFTFTFTFTRLQLRNPQTTVRLIHSYIQDVPELVIQILLTNF